MTDHQLYVLGLAFTPDGRIALIRKNRPDWQRGKWNGIGGKVEPTEDSKTAMQREFVEETGVVTHPDWWSFRGRLYGKHWSVFVMSMTHECVRKAKTVTDERVRLLHANDQQINGSTAIENLRCLIELCRLKPQQPSNIIPRFELNYRWHVE